MSSAPASAEIELGVVKPSDVDTRLHRNRLQDKIEEEAISPTFDGTP